MMTQNLELASVLQKQIGFAENLLASLETALKDDVPKIGRTGNSAMMIAGLIENYYTCLETAFQKISQHFENNLNPSRWHVDLLEKMTLKIEGVRIPALSDAAFGPLLELQRFRHFKRYYFELEYDWERLDYLVAKLRSSHHLIVRDLRSFHRFIIALNNGA